MSEINAIIWICGVVIMWAAIAFWEGRGKIGDEAPYLFLFAAVWPFMIVVALVVVPFVGIARLGAMTKKDDQ